MSLNAQQLVTLRADMDASASSFVPEAGGQEG